MRRLALVGLALATAGTAHAQSNRGAFAVDALIAPTTGFGFAYYVTDGLSLRPWLGLGYSDYSGFYANAGAQLRFEPMPAATVSPYLSATAQYSRYGDDPVTTAGPSAGGGTQQRAYTEAPGNGGQLGAGAGLRYRVAASVSLFAEGRVMRTTYALPSSGTGWATFGIDDHTRAEVVLGLSYLFR
jgi:hypothetical protein